MPLYYTYILLEMYIFIINVKHVIFFTSLISMLNDRPESGDPLKCLSGFGGSNQRPQ